MRLDKNVIAYCGNALIGLFSFTLWQLTKQTNQTGVWQRPNRAFFIYTQWKNWESVISWRCQCPKRVFFIHTQCLGEPRLIYSDNALNELSSFTLGYDLNVMVSTEVCQRPIRAFFIYTKIFGKEISHEGMCQRPIRAFFIYTVPAGNPHKHWLCRLISAGICLTILKTSLFLLFFGIVTFC